MKFNSLVLLASVLTLSPLMATAEDRVLFDFDSPEAAKPWQTVNDGVMGGRSSGRFKINEDKKMEFFGTLSLENNGGFASVRASRATLGLEKDDSIVARVRGDGREYSFNLYAQRNLGGYPNVSQDTSRGLCVLYSRSIDKDNLSVPLEVMVSLVINIPVVSGEY